MTQPSVATVPTIQPLAGHLLLMRTPPPDRNGRFVTPDNCRVQTAQGTVIAAGANTTVAAGEKIHFARYSVKEFRFQGQDYLMVSEDDVLAIITDGDD